MRFNKKASLEISIQAIVIVVLAMTLLGLGLGFIKGMFKNITSTTEDVSEQVRQRVLDDLVQGDKKISFPKTEVVIGRGQSAVLTVGIRNNLNTPLKYKMVFTPVSYSGSGTVDSIKLNEFAVKYFQYANIEYELEAGESHIRNIRLDLPSDIQLGSYFFTFDVIVPPYPTPGTRPTYYEQKDFFIVVRG